MGAEFEKSYMRRLSEYLRREKQQGKKIYPPGRLIFNALNLTPLNEVKVVLLGQDPYHGPGQAHGLCFSVQSGVSPPPSLMNIYKELLADLEIQVPPHHGDLSRWAQGGVLLLNSILTVEKDKPGSHAGIGWETFTDRIVEILNAHCENLVFMLWGQYAKNKGAGIDSSRHLVLKSTHPSPFAARHGFFGCRHFSHANQYLVEHGIAPVDWQPMGDHCRLAGGSVDCCTEPV